MFRKFTSVWLVLLLLISGCGLLVDSDAPDQENKEKKKEQKQVTIEEFVASKEIDDILREGPGPFAGENYDEEKVREELKKFPRGLSSEEVFNRLVFLFAENYEQEVKELDGFNTDIDFRELPKPQGPDGPKTMEHNVLILMDASGSMAERVDGESKMNLAKKAVKDFASRLPKGTRVSLRVYGHKGSNSAKDKKQSCESTEEVYPLGEYNPAEFEKSLNRFQPVGWTPLAASMEQAKDDLSSHVGENVSNVVYVVSDGVETCGGDPVKAAQELSQSNIQAVVNIIGFDVDNAGDRALEAVAKAGDGEYISVHSREGLIKYWKDEYRRLYYEWLSWRVNNRNQVLDIYFKKSKSLESISYPGGRIFEKHNREEERMLAARDYLEENGYWKDRKDALELGEQIRGRRGKIAEYRRGRYKSLKEELRSKKEELVKYIEDLSHQEQDKYQY
ncbi:hypothetical protein GCM10007416_21440 [Kroppenstedtia guangzhouensis]|uniref:VWFA domain-containing protein n=1 Tax=Kroppenstedtia guangzhouensis TaxID=1274356 RepID=A0ABQ1GQG1_9BACL|nr:VWA domain-containing protein [Kroppenstedtia guangzhouensis]GGA47983.1 hypothetical protein GCM10007416_21440 [Kroppenstedtia guangzhouensis]